MRALLILLVFPAAAGEGWIDLSPLSRWQGINGGEIPPAWSASGSEIRAAGKGSKALVSRDSFLDFELVWEWKLPPRGNSGIKYLVEEGRLDPDRAAAAQRFRDRGLLLIAGAFVAAAGLRWRVKRWWAWSPLLLAAPGAIDLQRSLAGFRDQPIGFEYQMIDNAVVERAEQFNAGLYDLIAPRAKDRAMGEWNESRIVVRGRRLEHWLNGELAVEAELGSDDLDARIASSKFRGVEGFGSKRGGKLALTHHSSDVTFRHLRVRRLDKAHDGS